MLSLLGNSYINMSETGFGSWKKWNETGFDLLESVVVVKMLIILLSGLLSAYIENKNHSGKQPQLGRNMIRRHLNLWGCCLATRYM